MNKKINYLVYALLGAAIAILVTNYNPLKVIWLEAGTIFGIFSFLWNRMEAKIMQSQSAIERLRDHLNMHTIKFAHEGMEKEFRQLQEKVMILEAQQQFGEDFYELREQVKRLEGLDKKL